MMITLNPDTAEKSPEVLKTVAQKHEGKAGLYAAVLTEGIVRKGDSIELLD
jgi:MOSC domain-containing protein YiiM